MVSNHRSGRSMFSIAGWLFADMLLAFMMIFIVASTTSVIILPRAHPPPTPRVFRLELKSHRFMINVDPYGLLNDVPDAVAAVKNQVRSQAFLKGRSVGLVIVYDGAPGDADISTAINVAQKVYSILLALGKQGFAFSRASIYDPLCIIGGSPSIVTVDVFLFA